MSVDIATALDFIRRIHPRPIGFAVLAAIRPDEGSDDVQHGWLNLQREDWHLAAERFITRYAATHNLYVTVADYRAVGQRDEANVLGVRWLYREADDVPLPAHFPPPSLVVKTSPGRKHEWWELRAPLDVPTAKRYLTAIADTSGLTHAAVDAARVLRLPGTLNHKHSGCLVRTLEDHADRVYDPAAFAPILAAAPTAQTQRRTGDDEEPILPGARRAALLALAGAMRRYGADAGTIALALHDLNERRCTPPLEVGEVDGLARDIATRYAPQRDAVRVHKADNGTDAGGAGAPAAWTPPASAAYPDPLAGEAFYGLVGEIVRAIEPHTESDPVALLLQLLVGIGNLIGRTPTLMMDGAAHHANLFAVLVGTTAKARKGTSWRQTRRVLAMTDPKWADKRITGGLSSGEGLIEAVADPDPDGAPPAEPVDKRLMIQVGEFASVLAVQGREGNTLSAVLRDAWDGDTLTVLNRKVNKLRATAPHISMVAHVTRDELLRMLQTTEAANGYANRFLWAAVRRPKLLPRGGNLTDEVLLPLVERLKEAVRCARQTQYITLTEKAWTLWDRVYVELSREQAGLLGAITARTEPLILRLAMLYALMDNTGQIDVPHLEAGCAVWGYCQQSAAWIFGDKLGDPDGDLVLSHLRQTPEGVTRTEIHGLLGRNRSAAQLSRALTALEEKNLARRVTEVPDGDRRLRTERWFATTSEGT